jgi:hypothetical protein
MKKAEQSGPFKLYYLLVIWNGVEPELSPPYFSYADVETAAKKIVRGDLNGRSSVYWVTQDQGKLAVNSWSGGQTSEWLEEFRTTIRSPRKVKFIETKIP